MILRLMISLGMGLGLITLRAEEPIPSVIRVAVLRHAPTLGKALTELCEHEYQGSIQVIRARPGSYLAVNTLDIEDYLLGVIGREMDPTGPLEALKAQAVAARTHALFEAAYSVKQPYDLVANLSQAYLGKARLHKNVVLAIEATRGEVLERGGRLFPAFFHSSCGGRTESAAMVWNMPPPAGKGGSYWIPGSVPCPYCAKAPENHWKLEVSVATLKRALKSAGYRVGNSPSIAIVEKSSSGRALKIAIRSELGETLLAAEKFRSLMGYSSLKSTLFEVSRETLTDGSPGDLFTFRGSGYGHGVGLCQYGACAMARHGAKYDEILTAYFPKTHLTGSVFQNLASSR